VANWSLNKKKSCDTKDTFCVGSVGAGLVLFRKVPEGDVSKGLERYVCSRNKISTIFIFCVTVRIRLLLEGEKRKFAFVLRVCGQNAKDSRNDLSSPLLIYPAQNPNRIYLRPLYLLFLKRKKGICTHIVDVFIQSSRFNYRSFSHCGLPERPFKFGFPNQSL